MADDTQKDSEFGAGMDELKETADAKKEGYDASQEESADFKAGWQAAHAASDPDNTGAPGSVAEQVHKDFENLTPEQREAYKKGYASGAESNK